MAIVEIRESVLLDDVSMEILSTAYLLRPADEQTLQQALRRPPTDFEERLDALEEGGFLRRVDGGLELESPYAAYVALGEARAEALIAENLRTVALMEALPQLIRAWDLGTAEAEGDHPLAVTMVHARSEGWEEWFRHAEAERPHRPSMVCPDPEVLRMAIDSGHLQRVQDQLADSRVRVLVPAEQSWGAEVTEAVGDARDAGIELRRGQQVPGWMYVDAPNLAALPVWWGSATPESAIAIRTPPVVAALDLLFDQLWAASEPWSAADEPWSDVVRLLAQGMTDEAVGRTLGVTTRTVRRRVAEAMAALGASSRFTLGMAWRERA